MINATHLETMTPLVWYINQKPDFIEFDKKNAKVIGSLLKPILMEICTCNILLISLFFSDDFLITNIHFFGGN